MHVTRSHAQAPKRSGPQFVCGVLRRILYDAIAGSHVVQQEVAERVNDFIAQNVGYDEGSPVYDGPCRCGSDAFDVTHIASDLFEKSLSGPPGGTCREHTIAGRHLGASHELRKVIDISKAEIVWNVLRIGRDLTYSSRVFRPQPIGDSHLV